MATSKSSKRPSGWIGGAMVFSGRPDPTWDVNEKTVKQLEEIWRTLEAYGDEPPRGPNLGYRGTFLRGPDGHQRLAYRGVVTLRTDSGSKSRSDTNRLFERVLLASAPEGTVPPVEFD